MKFASIYTFVILYTILTTTICFIVYPSSNDNYIRHKTKQSCNNAHSEKYNHNASILNPDNVTKNECAEKNVEQCSKDVEEVVIDCADENHLPQCKCSYVNCNMGNYKKAETNSRKKESPCLKCMECMAVARHLNETISDSLLHTISENQLSDINENEIKDVLTDSCVNGFTNFALKSQNSKTFLAPRSDGAADVIRTPYDNTWTQKLRAMCHTCVKNMDFPTFYNTALTGKPSISELFCTSHGPFPYCKNMNVDESPNTNNEITIDFSLSFDEE